MPLLVTVSRQIFLSATHVGTAPQINAIPTWSAYNSTTNFGYVANEGDNNSAFLILSIGY